MLRLSAEAAAAAPGAALHLVTLGPLTNLALALRKEPALSQRLGAVVVMGGCGNARGNASPTSEFNIRADPESAEEVFAALAMPAGSQQKVSVVPWELTEDYPLPWRWFDAALPARAMRVARAVMTAPAMGPLRVTELAPGESRASDDEILDWVRQAAETTYHPVGTCRMGQDTMAVVDSELRVRGVAGLRVADASVMPTLTSGNTNAPAIMIGEKAADMILRAAV